MRIRTRLRTLITRNELVEFEREEICEGVQIGRIVKASDRYLYLMQFDDEGRYDGVSIVRTEDVTGLRWGGNGLECISSLIRRHGRPPAAPTIALESFETVIRALDEHFGCVELHPELLDDDTRSIGELEEIDSETVVLHEYGTRRNLDRCHGLYRLSDITRVDADTIYTRDLVSLFESRREERP